MIGVAASLLPRRRTLRRWMALFRRRRKNSVAFSACAINLDDSFGTSFCRSLLCLRQDDYAVRSGEEHCDEVTSEATSPLWDALSRVRPG